MTMRDDEEALCAGVARPRPEGCQRILLADRVLTTGRFFRLRPGLGLGYSQQGRCAGAMGWSMNSAAESPW